MEVSGDIAYVHKTHPFLNCNRACHVKGFYRSWRQVLHLVVGVEAVEVKRSISPQVFVDPAGKFPELFGRVVVGRDYKVHYLYMDSKLLCKQGSFEHRSQFCTADVPVKFFGKSLYVHTEGVQVRGDLPKGFGGDVAVGDITRPEACLLCKFCPVVSILIPDGGLIVSPGNRLAARHFSLPDKLGGAESPRVSIFRGCLGKHPVLAVPAPEVAAHGPYGIGKGTRVIVVKRLYFDMRHCLTFNSPIDQGKEGTLAVFPDPADAPFSGLDFAAVGTKVTEDPVIPELFIKHGFMNH